MEKREYKYHKRKKQTRTVINILAKNICEAIDEEIIRILRLMASGETDIQNDLIPFGNKKLNL